MKLALAQLDIAFEDKSTNKETTKQFIKQAISENVDMIFFPEMTLTGFSMNPSYIGEDNSETIEFFKEMSTKYNLSIGFGYVEGTSHSKNKYKVVAPQGNELVDYAKIHPFSYGNETEFYESGNEIKHFNAFNFNITPFICYDLRFPEIFQLASKTATLITIAANWPNERREHWITLLKARAIENQCYIAGINRVGESNGLTYSGDSMIVDPLGNIIGSLYNEEGLVIADINQDDVLVVREKFRFKDDRKEELYYKLYNK
ncbi:carbon-nitrogen family hydrolase [Clostridium estertheticum]|uniref:Carbon-nitrogen family hydrolase n=1 Tax=Clostridium estertheticum TaxID=238834 RepID=A0AA47I729_9CLOT|nr:nitrilase-related carbon-nitrogen hydrolase [Clostridium estertheticum]MBU3155563.1 carbon-nitrogen family hydrolase [Clostridium estertheticum]MBU3198087.1 carbon-nitrogen family hydrolase [Clostridium estertheticum]WAG60039.1 carbon-nitrogen family hydrolase [Clostridium estertheticum]WAG65881.1 carbon-nitrogen family hydrolase [Clostridium estertheticum]